MFVVVAEDSRHGIESVGDQIFAVIGNKIQASKSNLMARGIAFDLLLMAERVGPQCEAAEYEGAIEPFDDSTVELSEKAPMSVSK